jgi:hypothetical protein
MQDRILFLGCFAVFGGTIGMIFSEYSTSYFKIIFWGHALVLVLLRHTTPTKMKVAGAISICREWKSWQLQYISFSALFTGF